MYLAGRYTPTPQGQLLSLLIGVIALSLATLPLLIGYLAVYGVAAALGLGAILSVLQGSLRRA